ncbi:hypothetical protein M422DRAFT_246883 [Sphaerobolus stellatus SS14]|nr:hypothetical protein M422DRAFT_246883 [Sphaerobolus stellatus SS14]
MAIHFGSAALPLTHSSYNHTSYIGRHTHYHVINASTRSQFSLPLCSVLNLVLCFPHQSSRLTTVTDIATDMHPRPPTDPSPFSPDTRLTTTLPELPSPFPSLLLRITTLSHPNSRIGLPGLYSLSLYLSSPLFYLPHTPNLTSSTYCTPPLFSPPTY